MKFKHKFEAFLAYLRSRFIKNKIPRGTVICDLGCGYDASVLKSLSSNISRGVGVDFDVAENTERRNIELVKADLNKALPLPSDNFDVVMLLATLEHIQHDHFLLGECFRILKPGGKVLVTVPTYANKPILEFLAFKLKLIDPEHVRDHKRYYDKRTLEDDLVK